jgi:N-acetylmuramoyl-L-alanine amidase
MAMQIKDHLLVGDNIKKFIPSPNHSGEFEKGDLDTVILHYTGSTFLQSINSLTNPSSSESAHVVIDRDGTVTQLVPFNIMAWHAGPSSYGQRTGFNKYSVGIELVNSGPLTKSGNLYRSWFGAAYNPSEIIEAVHRNQTAPMFWHIYTEEQISVVTEMCRLLVETYGMKYILGHEEIAPVNKIDPGPAFPLDRLRNLLLGAGRKGDGPETQLKSAKVTADILNIRDTPDPNGKMVAKPLTKGAKVKILEESNGWYKVSVELTGWVYSKFIENS